MPNTVQFGDTGELVSNAHKLRVSHPPGFPTFHLIQNVMTHLGIFESIFERASFLNIIISIATVVVFYLTIAHNNISALATALCLGTQFTFWKYAVLPDVFQLNNFLVCTILFLYFKKPTSAYRYKSILFLFTLGLTNHPTIIFLAPILICLYFQEKNKMAALKPILLNLLAFFILYSSLYFFKTDNLYAWSNISSLGDLFEHMTRKEYGVFLLNSSGIKVNFINTYLDFFKSNWALFFLTGISLLLNRNIKKTDMPWPVLASIILYLLVFFPLANIDIYGFGGEVMKRFYLMPTILIASLVAAAPNRSIAFPYSTKKIFFFIFLLLFPIINSVSYYEENNFSKNNIIQEHAINFLNQIENENKSVIVLSDDNLYGSLNYTQSILSVKPNIPVIIKGRLAQKKFRTRLREIGLPVHEPKDEILDFEADFLKPLTEAGIRLYFFENFNNGNDFKITFLPLGRVVEKGKGVHFAEKKLFPHSSIPSTQRPKFSANYYDPSQKIFAHYAFYFLAKGKQQYSENKISDAKSSFKEALAIVPYAIPAMQNLCILDTNPTSKRECEKQLEIYTHDNFNYF